MTTSSPVRQKSQDLQSVYTVYAQDELSRQSRRSAPKPRLLASQLSFHEAFLTKQRLGRLSEPPDSENGAKKALYLTNYLIFEMNRPSTWPEERAQQFLSQLQELDCSGMGLQGVSLSNPSSYSLATLNASENLLRLSHFADFSCARANFSDNKLTDEILAKEIEFFKTRPGSALSESLKELDLSANFFTDLALVFCLLSCFPKLQTLQLASCRFSALQAQFQSDESVLAHSQISSLCLDLTLLSNTQLKQIALALPALRVLSLNNCRLKLAHFVAIGFFGHLEVLSIRENDQFCSRQQILTVLQNVRLPFLKVIDMARADSKANCRNEAVCKVSVDSQLHVSKGFLPGQQHVSFVLYDRPDEPGRRIPLCEKESRVAVQRCMGITRIDAAQPPRQVLAASAVPPPVPRCRSELAALDSAAAEEEGESHIKAPPRACASSFAPRVYRPKSNRKHILAHDGDDYINRFIRIQAQQLHGNALIAGSLAKYFEQFAPLRTRAELLEQATAGAEKAQKNEAKLFDTELEEMPVARNPAGADVSIFDDRLLNRTLMQNLSAVLGPVTEEELRTHPIDISGLSSFLPRGTQSTTKEAFAALRYALERPLGDEMQINDEEILHALLVDADGI